MAYIQKPGGPLKQKTGHGLPSAFLQEKKPDYAKANKQEKESGSGAVSAAAALLKGYPQANNLKNFDAKKAVEQVQIASDSLNYISGNKSTLQKEKLSKDFFNNYSTNNPKVKKKLSKEAEGEYQGVGAIGAVGKGAGSQEAKAEVLGKLVAQGAKTFGQSDDSGMPNFGIPKIGTMGNPKSTVSKKPAPKQLKTPAKMKKC